MTESGESDGLVDSNGMFAKADYDFARPARREFRPWHKPRKQLVRSRQWGAEVEYLAQQRVDIARPVKYLTLPGPDMLDVRSFLQSAEYDLCFFGFDEAARPNSPAASDHNVSMHEIRRHPRVDLRSEVIGDQFALLADLDSVAWEMMARIGTFDLVNLDLCGHITAQSPGIGSLYEAIHNVVDFQSRRTEPWSLLLTTRVGKECVFEAIGRRLGQDLIRLIQGCPELRESIDELAPGLVLKLESPGFDLAKLSPDEFVFAFLLSVCMWLRELAGADRIHVELKSVYLYRVFAGSAAPDMASLVLRFEPVLGPASPDRLGISTLRARGSTECGASRMLARSVAEMQDIDEMLKSDQDLFSQVVVESANLLGQARYDLDAYLDWVVK